ncbi:MAG: hypothetical protein JSR21_19180 [Proteobacteria bacterium]|nr:hypothetical protein [Pseudomonadota bacterium]
MLLAAAWQRILAAFAAVALLWTAVFLVLPGTPSTNPARPAERAVPVQEVAPETAPVPGGLRAVVRAGQPAPGGGTFDRFDVVSQPVEAPVNARGQVAFYATVLHAAGREGIFLAERGRIAKVAAFGDPVPGGGVLAAFSDHPLPRLNAAGHVAFAAHIAGGRSPEGIFLATEDGLRPIALAGDDAPGIAQGVIVGFNPPALNDNDEMAFAATVRRGRDTIDALYFWNGRRLQRVLAEGDLLLRIGGTVGAIGEPALNNAGVIAFPAAIVKGPALGGIFVAGTRQLQLLVGAGDRAPSGPMILRFSERIAIDDADAITFGAYLGEAGSAPRAAILRHDPGGLSEVAVEREAAPGGGRYAGFGPWPTAAPDGAVAFVAAIDDGAAPVAAFAGPADAPVQAAAMGAALPGGGRVGRFVANAVAAAGPAGTVTIATMGERPGERDAILCRCP